jgi:hypothetical protein
LDYRVGPAVINGLEHFLQDTQQPHGTARHCTALRCAVIYMEKEKWKMRIKMLNNFENKQNQPGLSFQAVDLI